MQLDYSVAPSCPGPDVFEGDRPGRLGYNPFRADAPGRVLVRIEPMGRALEGRLEWQDSAGERIGEHTFPSRTGDCGELARAMGFALALQIQLLATTTAEPPPPRRRPSAAGGATDRDRRRRAGDRDQPPRTDDIRSFDHGGCRGAAGFGVASSVVPVGRLFGTVGWSHVAVELGGELGASSSTRQADGSGFSQRQILGTLAGCGVRRPWSLCLVAKLGRSGWPARASTSRDSDGTAGPNRHSSCRDTHARWSVEIVAHADGLALADAGDRDPGFNAGLDDLALRRAGRR